MIAHRYMGSFGAQLVAYVGGVVVVMAVGGCLPLVFPAVKRHLHKALSLGAGVMLGSALLHMLPESFVLVGEHASVGVLAGMLFLYSFEKFVTVHVCEAVGCEVHSMGLSALFGLSLHTFVNGVALGSSITEGIAPVVFAAIAIHKLPESFSLSAILLHDGYQRTRIVLMNILFISMIPVGALVVFGLSAEAHPILSGYVMAFSAGTFLHIAVSDLLPEVHKASRGRYMNYFFFLLGIVWMAMVHD